MLHDQDLPQLLWGEALKKRIYIQNWSPHKILDNMTLEEVFTGRKPCVYHLRIFGFPVYIHIPKYKMKKLDPTSMKGIFVSYSTSSKTYRIYIKEGHWIEVEMWYLMKTLPTRSLKISLLIMMMKIYPYLKNFQGKNKILYLFMKKKVPVNMCNKS